MVEQRKAGWLARRGARSTSLRDMRSACLRVSRQCRELLDEDCFVPGWRGDCSCPATLAVARAGWAPVIRMPKPTPRCRRQNLHFAVLKMPRRLRVNSSLAAH